MLESQKLLKNSGITSGGSRIELVGWTETDLKTLERFNVHRIDVDDKPIWIESVAYDCDNTAQQSFAYFSARF